MAATAPSAHHSLLDRLAGDPHAWSRDERLTSVAQIEKLRAWLDAREASVLAVIHEQADDVAAGARNLAQLGQKTGGVGYAQAKRRARRAHHLPALPIAHDALEAGRLGTEQADELCGLAERLAPEHASTLAEHERALVTELGDLTPSQARKRVARFEQELQDDDGASKAEEQRARNAHRERRNADGTSTLFTDLDPVSAAQIRTCIDRMVEELWRRDHRHHDGALPDGVLSHQKRRAEAVVELIRRGHAAAPANRGHADVIVLIDHQTLLGELSLTGRSELADGTPLSAAEARRLACEARIIPVVMGGASLPLDVGRASRVATSAQKAALRAVHGTCCVDGCDVPYDYCQLHHLSWWSAGGRTDLSNLAPVCADHHHLLHDHGWELRLDHQRVGTLHRSSAAPAPGPSGRGRPAPRTGNAARRPEAPAEQPTDRKTSTRRSARSPGLPPRNRSVATARPPDRAVPPDATTAPQRC